MSRDKSQSAWNPRPLLPSLTHILPLSPTLPPSPHSPPHRSESTAWGRALSGPLVSTLLCLLASNLCILPSHAAPYAAVNRFLLPLAVPLLLFGADLRRVVRDTGRLLLAFVVGAGM